VIILQDTIILYSYTQDSSTLHPMFCSPFVALGL